MTDIGFENLRISDGPHDPPREHELPVPPQPATSAMPAPPGIAVEGVMWQGHDESDDSDDEQPLSVPTFGDNSTLPPPPPPPMHGNSSTTRPVSVRNEAAMQRNSFRPTRFIKAEQKGKASPAAIQMMPQEMANVQRMYEHYQSKVYMEGYLYRKSERSEHEGWVRTYVELCGPVLTMWDADKDDQSEVMPQYLNIADATAEYNDQSMVSLKAGGISRLLFEIDPDSTSHDNRSAVLDRWIRAVRLSCFEGARIHEIYTKKIIMRHKNSSEDGDEEDDILAKPIPKMESFLQVRFAGVNEWQKYWVVVSDRPNTKKLFGKKSSTPQQGQLLFYESKKAKHPIKVLTNVFQAYTIYPETPQLADMATLLKIDGTTGGTNSDESDEGGVPASVLMMTTNTRYLVQWLVGVYDTFKLYGRPSQLLRDPTNANSLNFGETVSSTRLFLEVDEISGMDVYADGTEKNRMAMTDVMLNKFKQPAIQHVPINGGGMGPRTNSMPQIAPGPPGNNNNARVPRQRTVSADAEVPMAGGAAANPRATMMMNAYGGGPNRTSVYPMQNQPPMMPQQQQQQQQHRVSTMPRTQSGKIIYASDDSDEDEDEDDESESEDEDDDDDDDSVFGGGDQHHSNAHKADSNNSNNKASPTATPTPTPLPAASSSTPSITDKNADAVNHNDQHDDKQVSNDTLDKQSDNESEKPKTPAKAKQRRPNPINSDESSSEEEEEEEDSEEDDDASDEEYTPHRPKSRWPTNNNATSRASTMSPTPMQQQQQQQQPQSDYQLPPFEIDQQPMMDMYNHPMYQQQAVIDEDGPIIPQLGEDFANPHSLLGSVSKTDPQVTVRDQAEYAKATGQPLVSISQQPKDPKAGLVGMISQIEHDKKNPNKGRMMDAERERLMMEQQQQQQAMMGGPMMGMMDPRMSMMPPNMMMGGHNSMMMMPMMDPRMSMMPPNMMMMPMMDPRMSMMNPNMMNNGNGNNSNPHASMMMPPTSMGNPHASMMMQQPPSSMPSGSNTNTNPHASMMMPPPASTMAGMNGGNGGGNGHASMMIPMMDPRMSMMPPNMMMYGGMWNGQQQHFGQQQQFGIPEEEDDEDDDVPLGAGSQAKPSSSKK